MVYHSCLPYKKPPRVKSRLAGRAKVLKPLALSRFSRPYKGQSENEKNPREKGDNIFSYFLIIFSFITFRSEENSHFILIFFSPRGYRNSHKAAAAVIFSFSHFIF
jgi:hypothetical protein